MWHLIRQGHNNRTRAGRDTDRARARRSEVADRCVCRVAHRMEVDRGTSVPERAGAPPYPSLGEGCRQTAATAGWLARSGLQGHRTVPERAGATPYPSLKKGRRQTAAPAGWPCGILFGQGHITVPEPAGAHAVPELREVKVADRCVRRVADRVVLRRGTPYPSVQGHSRTRAWREPSNRPLRLQGGCEASCFAGIQTVPERAGTHRARARGRRSRRRRRSP